ncbi:MAG: amidase [Lysobacterales bacterium]
MTSFLSRSATQALTDIDAGQLNCEQWIAECSENYRKYEPTVQAFASWAGDAAQEQAIALDQATERGPLNGLPLAVKDVFDTSDLPTRFNSPLYPNRQPTDDAACVALLKHQGAIVVGKASTVEFASLGRTAATANPHDNTRTPGGSSSGSAAAVAAGMAAVALGTQTGGSTIRPASFCGIAAMKPTFGVVPVTGMRPYAPSLDTVGWMARTVSDLNLVADAFEIPAHALLTQAPRIGFYPTPYWESAETESRDALEWAMGRLKNAGMPVTTVQHIPDSERLNEAQNIIMHGEGRASFLYEYARWPDQLHPGFIDEVENVLEVTPEQFRWAYDYLGALRPAMDQAMQGFDAWLTPAVAGVAPVGLNETGDAVFNRLWTGLHMPTITLPGYCDSRGLPVGIQLAGQRHNDRHLLQVASVVENALGSTQR